MTRPQSMVEDHGVPRERLRILLVDDDPEDQELTVELLHQMEGWEPHVRVASTYEEGMQAVRSDYFHAMLVDYRLGARTGVDFLQEPEVAESGTPVILLTGQGARKVDLEATRAGAADYLVKGDLKPAILERALRYAVEVWRRHRVEARFKALMENSRDIITVLDAGGRVTYISPAVERILGFTPEERQGMAAPWGVHPGDRDRAKAAVALLLEDPDAHKRLVTRVAHKDGSWRVLDTVFSNHLDDPLIHGIVANSWDVTELAGVQAELHDRSRDLQERIKELRTLYDVHRILHEQRGDWTDITPALAQRLPAGFQYPERVAARVQMKGAEGRSERYAAGGPSLLQPILVDGLPVGEVEVVFVHDAPAKGPAFLPEEAELLQVVADRVAEAEARRRAEEAVTRSAAYFRALTERAGLGIVVVDREGRIGYASESAGPLAGTEVASLEDTFVVHLFEAAAHPDVGADLQAAIDEPGAVFEGEGRAAPGESESPRMLAYTVRSLLDEPAVRGVVLTLRDITEKVEQEEHIRFQAELLDAVGQAVIASDMDRRVIYWNRAAEQLYGWSAEEALGRDILDLTPGEASHDDAATIMDALLRGEPWSGEFQARHRDGTAIPVLVSNAPVIGRDGTLRGIIGVSSDLRQQKELESRLRQAQKMEAIGRLAGGVAHDFNNLLTAIHGHAELLMGELPSGSALHADALEIHRAGSRAANLTRQLLTFSRKQVLEEKVLDLGAILRDMDPMLRRLLPATIEVRSRVAERECTVMADAGQMQQVILNLALNAGDAMEQGGSLSMTVERTTLDDSAVRDRADLQPGDYVRLTVRDTGTGMTPEVLTRIFEPFFTTKPEGRGTGLGLATVFGIVEQAGGRILVDSSPGRGSTFTILLPRAVGESPDRVLDEEKTARTNGQETLLLVEDDPAVRGLVRRILSRKGYTLLEATNGYEALRLAEEYAGQIHLVVSDMVMPEMGGAELVARLGELYPGLRVILTSGYSEQALEGSLLDLGAAFLPKPFTPNDLTSLVRRCLDA